MIGRWQWAILQISRKLWVKAALFCVLAIVTALLAILLKPYIPADLTTTIGADAVDQILSIIASSMLAVTTFSLGTMVAAYSAAANSATPRATKLLIEDATTHNVLATFIGSFLFALVGLVTLRTGAYGEQGRVVLFVATIAVIVIIVVTLLRWIEHLTKLGRISDTIDRVEEATLKSLRDRIRHPFLGCHPLDADKIPEDAHFVAGEEIGYVQYIDIAALEELAEKSDTDFYILALPGTFCDPTRSLLAANKRMDDDQIDTVSKCFVIGSRRTFDQDPRFGLCVLAEIASRALSPAVNDSGTAIDVIGCNFRALSLWLQSSDKRRSAEVKFCRLYAPGLTDDDLFDDAFAPIARDGANTVEVELRLQKALLSLSKISNGAALGPARQQSALALAHAKNSLTVESEKNRVRDIARQI
jgi:uncharacterized membrane protein